MQRSERFRALIEIYDGLLGPLSESGEAARSAAHPDVLARKWEWESEWLTELQGICRSTDGVTGGSPASMMRTLAARHRIPEVYSWLAASANRDQLLCFLGAEGGPDAGFDDLVAVAQLGLGGEAKLELATNYWDELGNGLLAGIHTELHRDTCSILGVHPTPLPRMSERALERAAFTGLLATNHWLQPELLGALGMVELQAGPRCRQVLKAMQRLGAPSEAQEFYRVHAEVDPRHGADWLTHVIEPLSQRYPAWGERFISGARWRLALNDGFLAELFGELRSQVSAAA